jgi:hypothetical protein
MAKGLCKRCGEKWSRGHQCVAAVQLNTIQEIWDIIEEHHTDTSPVEGIECPTGQLFMAISVAAVSGQEAPKTLKLKGVIQGYEVLILLDSGSSHSFISTSVASFLAGVTNVSNPCDSDSSKWATATIFC